MPTLHVNGLVKGYGADTVFDGVSFRVTPRERLALVGRNGSGKTTLLRVLSGELEPDGGQVARPRAYRIALHDQRPPLAREITLGGYISEGVADLHAAEERLRVLERRMAGGDGSPETLRAYEAATVAHEAAGGYAWRSRLESILRGLGFDPVVADRPLGSFSGGELTRASLARALAANPDLLLLDEPTNHLDLLSLEWLEDELTSLDVSIVLVSHDRWFLERVATGVLELERGRGKVYAMRYSAFRREKAEALAAQADAFERQQQELERLQRFVDKFRAGTRSRQAQSKQKALERIERVDRPRREKSLAFGFPKATRSGRIVAEVDGLVLRNGDKSLLEDASFAIERGQRVALVGPNGSGKTTFVEALLGARGVDAGKLKLGHGVEPAYFSQHASELPDHLSVVEALAAGSRARLTQTQARTILGVFLFTQGEVERKVGVLSGGERRRLALATIVASGANLLVLDEPTNHLDVESREALEDALDAFEGTILLVSHDRALIDAVATHTASIEERRIVLRPGDYNDLLEARATQPTPAPPPLPLRPKSPPRPRTRPIPVRPPQRVTRKIAEVEATVARLETEQRRVESDLADPTVMGDAARLAEVGRRHRELTEELAWKLREWEELQESVSGGG